MGFWCRDEIGDICNRQTTHLGGYLGLTAGLIRVEASVVELAAGVAR